MKYVISAALMTVTAPVCMPVAFWLWLGHLADIAGQNRKRRHVF
jgi:uncharacterized membrane protein